MSARWRPTLWGIVAVTALAVGCNEKPLAPRSRVISPRVLAIIAEPPEVQPGQSVALRVVFGGIPADAGTPTFRWLVCARPEATTTFTAQSTYGEATPDEGCFGDAAVGVLPVGEGTHVTLLVPADILQQLDALRAVYGPNLPPDTLYNLAHTAGLPATVALEMTSGDTVVRAIKRVVITDRAVLNTNPPPPSFHWDARPDAGAAGIAVSGASSPGEDTCLVDGARELVVRPTQRVELAPDPTEASWLEDYDVIDSTGSVSHLQETAFYAWFTTDGWFDAERTRIPTRDTVWQAPGIAGHVTQWLVVRDGRGGTSACRYEIQVR